MSGASARGRAHWRLTLRGFRARPRLVVAMAAGLAAGLAWYLLSPMARPSASAVVGWDAFCALYLALVLQVVSGKQADEIRARAAREDEGQAVILALVVAASAASVAAVGVELRLAQHDHGAAKALYVAMAVASVAMSWLLMQVVYALHYAHEYYRADPHTGKDLGGLAFPGGGDPDYWDFLHFSIVIGVAAQTADIAFTDRRLRRLGTSHSLIAFVFNTLIVAMTINLAAGLF